MYLFWLFRAKIRIIPRTGLLCASWFHSGKTVHVLTFLFSVFIRHVKPFSKFFDIFLWCLMSMCLIYHFSVAFAILVWCILPFVFFAQKKQGKIVHYFPLQSCCLFHYHHDPVISLTESSDWWFRCRCTWPWFFIFLNNLLHSVPILPPHRYSTRALHARAL